MANQIPPQLITSVVSAFFGNEAAAPVTLDELIQASLVPESLEWQPDLCLRSADKAVLVCVLADKEIPDYVIEAAARVESDYPNTKTVILARELVLGSGSEKTILISPYAAAAVAQKCIEQKFGLAFEVESRAHLVFAWDYVVPAKCKSHGQETGHIPSWILTSLEARSTFSEHMKACIKKFAKKYQKAVEKQQITYNAESKILIAFAEHIAEGNKKLHVPMRQLEVLAEWELRRANPKSRDHFFHTFNNFLMGLYILSFVAKDGEFLCDADSFIEKKRRSGNLATWEALWLMTCLFHDPAYIAENQLGTLRFSYGFMEDEALDERELDEKTKQHIKNAWDTEYKKPRTDLVSLYEKLERKWSPPSTQKEAKTADAFDQAMETAYFDGRVSSHSLVSGFKLIKYCQQDDVPSGHDPKESHTVALIAALSMMFHDPRCRNLLTAKGIKPIPFEKLPYAAVLMFVDSLQDDRRTIKVSRFDIHGVLEKLEVADKAVTATVCLPEVAKGVEGWPGRIAEYESVMQWINSVSGVKFSIVYRKPASAS